MKTSKDLKQSGSTDTVSGLFVFVLYLYTAVFFTVLRIYGKITPKTNFGGIYLKISVKTQGKWTQTDTLWSALFIDDRLKKDPGQADHSPVLSFVGGGGKTSYIRRLAWEGREKGCRVLVMTTTHMAVPEYFGVLEPDLGQVEKMLEKEGIAVAGCPAKEGKIAFRDWEFYEKAGKLADVILVEADGSKRLPVKVPGPKEPVIPENSDQILCIYGLGALGKQAADCCFRMQPSEQLLKIPEDQKDGKWIMTEEKMSLLMKKGYLEPLRQQFPYSQVIPVFNQADTMKLEENGKNILERMEEERGILTGELWKETSFNLF